jgi:hypothetical protein
LTNSGKLRYAFAVTQAGGDYPPEGRIQVRFIKMLGLAAITAVAAMAFVGVSSAMAEGSTALCKSNEGGAATCVAGNLVTSMHAVSVGEPELKSNLGTTIKCLESLSEGTVLGLGNPQIAHLTSLTFTHCYNSTGLCEVETLLTGLFEILRLGSNLADVKSVGNVVLVKCPLPFGGTFHCAYGGEPVLHGLGAELPSTAGKLTASELVLTRDATHSLGGFTGCPSESKWTTTYEVLGQDVYIKE